MGGDGGPGHSSTITGQTTRFAGGGGGGSGGSGVYRGGLGFDGGGQGGPNQTAGKVNTGGGSGGCISGSTESGGSGIVILRYQIAESQLTSAAKATGGQVSFYDSKTIHTFTSTGAFAAPASFSETVEYVVIAGGGSGGGDCGGGGGAGGYRTGSTPFQVHLISLLLLGVEEQQ